jgi:hypothetical protein
MAFIIRKPRSGSHSQGDVFRQINAFNLRFEGNLGSFW